MNAQELILGRLLPVAAAIAVFWIVYRLLFTNSNRIKFNRFYILASIVIAFLLPFLGIIIGNGSPQMLSFKQNIFGEITLNEVILAGDANANLSETSTQHYSIWQVVVILYFIGVGISLLLLMFKLLKIFLLIVKSQKEKYGSYTAVFTGKEQGSFSFLNYAFFPDQSVDKEIVRHEISHISHRHSWDIVFVEVMMVLQWFNPFIYMLKRELQCVHEYQADRDVVDAGVNKRDYMMLILQQCTAVDFSRISNNFSLILTKKRIKMITMSEKTKGLWWRLLVTLPVLAVMLVANTNATAKEQLAENNPKAKILTDAIKDVPQSKDSIYENPEVMPVFPGGDAAMIEFLQKNMVYPENAKKKGITGKVFVGFVVEANGSITDVKVLRGFDKECDAEAVRLVKLMPKWKPGSDKGKPLRVRFVMPFNFKL